jgi:hypothetical protein
MKPVEQAIFALLDTDRSAGYQVVAGSVGVCAADAQELAVWGPAHDSLIDMGPGGESFNFHPLPSGAHCVSRTVAAGWEHEGGRQRVFTHCLIVPPEVLARFGNNPFALIRAAAEQGLWRDQPPSGARLEPVPLTGRAAVVDEALLGELALDPGPENMAALVQAARDAVCLAITGAGRPDQWIAGLFSCFPPECRLEFSFSTGLKFSPRRPFRIVALSGDPAERRWVGGCSNVVVLELVKDAPSSSMPLDGWARLIEQTLSTGQIALLAGQLSKRRFELTPADLPVLGLQLIEDLDALEFGGVRRPLELPEKGPARSGERAHAAHRQFDKSMTAGTMTPAAPTISHDATSPQVLELLEGLDDLVYEAIGGRTGAMEELQAAWPKVLAKLGEDLLTESREQYLRYALSVWEECVDSGGIRNPTRAIQALDVLCLLFGDAT